MSRTARLRIIYFTLGLLTVPAGLMVRFAPLGLPWFVVKYGGSMLWTVMVYWTLAFLTPETGPKRLASGAAVIATLVEFQRLVHMPWLDRFRVSLPGILLLGRVFSLWDIVAYFLAIAIAATIDRFLIRKWSGLGNYRSGAILR